ncbi:hypothetical protein [Citrobacter europaeus]|jgi:hypothetical protein|uniref:hypothetical protein n=1 Tax=Citrobacter europaeus TaxID=1914243 RepID=UPI0018FFB9B4|nr:hypothetical protein [Citrobacter europaeus]MBJ8823575.1 hypothetical protein [Citrobacter freundii]MDT7086261.1 hypothetical protein [Citrobacter europaeus]
MIKKCVFCGRSQPTVQFSKEHVLPAWLSREITLSKHLHYKNQLIGKKIIERNIPGQTPFTMTVNKVCSCCNNGWMSSKLESAVKETLMSLIEGRNTVLNHEKQKLVSLWAIKTALIIGLMDGEGEPAIMAHYNDIYHLKIPSNVYIWIVNTGPGYGLVSTRHMRFKYYERDLNHNPEFMCASYYTSINIGSLSIQILAMKDASQITGYNIKFFKTYLQNCSKRLHPIKDKLIKWPLKEYVHTDPRMIMDLVIKQPALLKIAPNIPK